MKYIKRYTLYKENKIEDDKIGKEFYFEYHCLESPSSMDAEIWYHSHQKCSVLKISALGGGETAIERSQNGEPRCYEVKFKDGFTCDVFEDELMNSEDEYYRPNPPIRENSSYIDIQNHIIKYNNIGSRDAFMGNNPPLKNYKWNENIITIYPNIDDKIDKSNLYPASKKDVIKYMDMYKKGHNFPPIVLVDNGEKYAVFDGAHRLQAAINLNVPIDAYIGYMNITENYYEGNKKYDTSDPIHKEKFLVDLDYTLNWAIKHNPKFETSDEESRISHIEKWLDYDVNISKKDNIKEFIKTKTNTFRYDIIAYMKVYKKAKSAGYIKLYRQIAMDKLTEFNYKNIGIYWSFENPLTNHINVLGNGKIKFVISANVKFENINWENGLDNYLYFGDSECEVKLYSDANIQILDIKLQNRFKDEDVNEDEALKFIANIKKVLNIS